MYRQIFINCVKIDPKNIFTNRDITLKEFEKRFFHFIQIVKKNPTANVIITYSGHGDDDGSLVFVDGKKLFPEVLKGLVNSFSNDTTLIIDACYSGNNEGPKEMYKSKKSQGFKDNSFRIYASLAHLTAKEISYSNTFFSHIKPFYGNVLKIKKISGNGYFTAMVGLFFAEYEFKDDENITFKDLVSYVTNRGKQYVEYLALWGKSYNLQRKFATVRLNQQPKILPIQKKVALKDENHQFILIHKYLRPLGLELSLSGGIFFPMSVHKDIYNSPSIFTTLSLGYEMKFITKRFFLTLNFNYLNMSSISNSAKRDVKLNILIPSLGVKYYPFELSFFRMSVGLDGGAAMTLSQISSFGPLKEESNSVTNFYGSADISFQFKLMKNFYINIPAKLLYIAYGTNPLYGFSATAGLSYYF